MLEGLKSAAKCLQVEYRDAQWSCPEVAIAVAEELAVEPAGLVLGAGNDVYAVTGRVGMGDGCQSSKRVVTTSTA